MTTNRPEEWKAIHAAHRHPNLVTRTFLVVGNHKIKGKSKGETVELELTGDQIDALIIGGHIQEVPEVVAESEAAPEGPSVPGIRKRRAQK
jgi:hypothetical protein